MRNQALKKEEKRIGAFIRYDCNSELNSKLKYLAEYQEENNIGKINRYYTADNQDNSSYYKAITDIFEEDIDTLLVVGIVADLWAEDEIIEKIIQNIQLILV